MEIATPAMRALGVVWRPFSSLSAAEVSFVVVRQLCEFPTRMFVTCVPGKTSFAVVGPDSSDVFHWAVFNAHGQRLDEGWEISCEEAKRIARESQQLWSHRCELRDNCHCAAHKRG